MDDDSSFLLGDDYHLSHRIQTGCIVEGKERGDITKTIGSQQFETYYSIMIISK